MAWRITSEQKIAKICYMEVSSLLMLVYEHTLYRNALRNSVWGRTVVGEPIVLCKVPSAEHV